MRDTGHPDAAPPERGQGVTSLVCLECGDRVRRGCRLARVPRRGRSARLLARTAPTAVFRLLIRQRRPARLPRWWRARRAARAEKLHMCLGGHDPSLLGDGGDDLRRRLRVFPVLEHPGLGSATSITSRSRSSRSPSARSGRGSGRPGDDPLLDRRLDQPRNVLERDLTISTRSGSSTSSRSARSSGWFAAHYRQANAAADPRAARSRHRAAEHARLRAGDRTAAASCSPFALLVGDFDAINLAEDRDHALPAPRRHARRLLCPDLRPGAGRRRGARRADRVRRPRAGWPAPARLELTLCETGARLPPSAGRRSRARARRADALPRRRRAALRAAGALRERAST